MADILKISENRPTSLNSPKHDLDTLKSVFYWINAKPDTDTRILEGRKIVKLPDIRSLKDQIDHKLKLHLVQNYIASINFILSGGSLKDYGSWAEFERENWQTINNRTKAINFTLDMTLTLPDYAIPQRHTLKLKIGEAIPPKDMFQIMFNSDDSSEIILSQSNAYCKIDFINQTLANELFLIVCNWYDGLEKVVKPKGFHSFLTRKEQYVLAFVANFTPVIVFYIYHLYFSLLCKKGLFSNILNVDSLQSTLVIVFFVVTIGILLGKYFASWLNHKIDKFKNFSGFIITKGDENNIKEVNNENEANKNSIMKKFVFGIITTILMAVFKYFLSKYLEG